MYRLNKVDIVPPILALPRNIKRAIVLMLDASFCIVAVWLAYYLRLGTFIPLTGMALVPTAVSLCLALPIFIRLGLYRAIYRYSGWQSVGTICMGVGLYGVLFATLFTVISVPDVPRTVGLIQPMLLLIFVAGSRAAARFVFGLHFTEAEAEGRKPVIIYGAGRAGRQLATALGNTQGIKVVGFADDDPRLAGSTMDGVPIHNGADVARRVREDGVAYVLLAMPEATRPQRSAILDRLRAVKVDVRLMPPLERIASGDVTIADLRPLSIEDLLGRERVAPDRALMSETVEARCVLVTGAGGSIGAELCRQICALRPRRLILVEQSEFALYDIHLQLGRPAAEAGVEIVPVLGSVRDGRFMERVFRANGVEAVFHAAAYKHVPLVEQNVVEGVRNNVWGTRATAEAAARAGVARFVLISTDKAVRPTNVMGASKRLAELVLQGLEPRHPGTRFSMVRFGNVLGSSGSVVPRFRKQIEEGGPVTLTHPEITRFFMSIPEAAQLVIQSSAMARGGDVFVLDMGQPTRIHDLAVRMIELSGRTLRSEANPDGEIAIEITGLRPGEKLYEELLLGDDPQPTRHPRIMRAQDSCLAWDDLVRALADLDRALEAEDVGAVRAKLRALPLKYGPQGAGAELRVLKGGVSP